MINAIININKVIIRDVNLFSDVNDFFQEFVNMIMTSLINFFLRYD